MHTSNFFIGSESATLYGIKLTRFIVLLSFMTWFLFVFLIIREWQSFNLINATCSVKGTLQQITKKKKKNPDKHPHKTSLYHFYLSNLARKKPAESIFRPWTTQLFLLENQVLFRAALLPFCDLLRWTNRFKSDSLCKQTSQGQVCKEKLNQVICSLHSCLHNSIKKAPLNFWFPECQRKMAFNEICSWFLPSKLFLCFLKNLVGAHSD